jgi:hypothetical protein
LYKHAFYAAKVDVEPIDTGDGPRVRCRDVDFEGGVLRLRQAGG